MLQAIVFDFDGVIADSESLHWQAFREILAPFGIDFTWEEYLQRYVGLDDRGALEVAFAQFGLELPGNLKQKLVETKADVFLKVAQRGVSSYPGVRELVSSAARNLPIALCSGALRSDIVPVLKALDLERFFPLIVSADDVDVSKPDPASYVLALKRLSTRHGSTLDPGACLAIEDTPSGIASARGAGMPVLGITNNFPAELLSEATWSVSTLEGLSLSDLKRMVVSIQASEAGPPLRRSS